MEDRPDDGHEPDFIAHSVDSEMSLSALCCRSSPHLAMSLPSLLGALPRCGSSCRSASAAVTQMEAAIGWLQRNAGLSGEGRVSLPEVDSCSVTAAQRLSGDCGATSAFPAWLEARRVPAGASPSTGSSGYWTVKTPRRQWRQPLTAATTRIWCCTPSKMLTGLRKREPEYAKTEYEFHRSSVHARIQSDEKWEDCRTYSGLLLEAKKPGILPARACQDDD